MEKAALIHFDVEDIRLAVRHPDDEIRALATQRLCREMRDNALSKDERRFAQKLLQYIAKELSPNVSALAIMLLAQLSALVIVMP